MEVQQLATNVPERFVPESMRDELLAAEHLARYEWAGGLAPGRRVLDAGCGTGYGAEMLAAAGAASVMGVDSAAAVVEAARARAGGRLAFERADVARLPYDDGSFDLVTCFEVIEHVPDPGAVLGELRRVLAPGGVLAISSPNADRYPPGNPHHVREFTTSEFRALLAEAFPAVRLLAQHQWISSAVLEERDLEPGALSVRTVKADARRLGSETYTVALAGSGSLPELPAAAALTGTVEVRRWLEHFEGQQRMLADQADYLADLGQRDRERLEVGRLLASAEAELAGVRAELEITRADLADAREQHRQSTTALARVLDSVSWRCTRPLRDAKALARRRESDG